MENSTIITIAIILSLFVIVMIILLRCSNIVYPEVEEELRKITEYKSLKKQDEPGLGTRASKR